MGNSVHGGKTAGLRGEINKLLANQKVERDLLKSNGRPRSPSYVSIKNLDPTEATVSTSSTFEQFIAARLERERSLTQENNKLKAANANLNAANANLNAQVQAIQKSSSTPQTTSSANAESIQAVTSSDIKGDSSVIPEALYQNTLLSSTVQPLYESIRKPFKRRSVTKWINNPQRLAEALAPPMYELVVNGTDSESDSIMINFDGNRLEIENRYLMLKRSYEVPDTCNIEKMISFFSENDAVVVQIPLPQYQLGTHMFMSADEKIRVAMPADIDLSTAIKLTDQSSDLVVKFELLTKRERAIFNTKYVFYICVKLPDGYNPNGVKLGIDESNKQLEISRGD